LAAPGSMHVLACVAFLQIDLEASTTYCLVECRRTKLWAWKVLGAARGTLTHAWDASHSEVKAWTGGEKATDCRFDGVWGYLYPGKFTRVSLKA